MRRRVPHLFAEKLTYCQNMRAGNVSGICRWFLDPILNGPQTVEDLQAPDQSLFKALRREKYLITRRYQVVW